MTTLINYATIYLYKGCSKTPNSSFVLNPRVTFFWNSSIGKQFLGKSLFHFFINLQLRVH